MMIDFVWHLRGSVALESVAGNEFALDGLERLLEKQRKSITGRTSDCVTFSDPLWRNPFNPNWLAMVIYDRGNFWIEQNGGERRLRYDLRSLHGMVFCLFGATMFFGLGLASEGLVHGLSSAGLAFGWLYGMNILLALMRVPHAVRRAVRGK